MHRRRFGAAVLTAAGALWRPWRARGDEVPDDPPSTGRINAVAPTFGGRQFWADELFYYDWHIQRNVFSGHYRLLDGSNKRYAWGSFDECVAKLDEIKQKRGLAPMHGPGVVVLHGLFRSAASMVHMARYLREQGNYTVFNVSYPTTRGELGDHAATLDKVIRNLTGIDRLDFVAHSLGNLVIRRWLADRQRGVDGVVPDKRVHRMVMLGPPNNGAQMAEYFAKNHLFRFVAGASATQMAEDWQAMQAKLCTPACPFGILAGGRSGEKGYNPLLTGDNDLVVSVESTRLCGATDFAVLPVVHTLMMDDPKVQEMTLRFLRHGYFTSADERQPIPVAS